MRNPGRRDGDDARVGSTDSTVPQAGSDGGLAGDEPVDVRASDGPRNTEPHSPDHADRIRPTGNDALDFDADPADVDDDLLFDPLLSDEPIDLAAVRADDALIDALSGGDLAAADDPGDDDPLIAMLAAWAASARPDPAATSPMDRDVAATGPAPRLRPVTAVPADETAGGRPEVVMPATGSPGAGTSDDEAPDAGSPELDETDGVTERRPDLDLPTVRLSAPDAPTAEHGPLSNPAGDGPVGAPRTAAATAASVVTLFSRVRTAGRRTRRPGRALPAGHPLRRAAVAVVVAALGVSGAAASGGTAQPGDPAWAITKVFFADRARSIMAAQVVSAGLERAQIALRDRRPELAKQELAAISASLLSVREEEGHTRLVDQKQMLEAVAALTPPLPSDPNLTATTTPSRRTDADSSVLAQATPHATGKDVPAPPVVVKPADPGTGSTGTKRGTTTTDGTGTADETGATGTTRTGTTGSTGTGTTGTGTTGTGTTGTGTTGTTSTETGSTGTTSAGTSGSVSGTGSTAADPTETGTVAGTTGTGTGPGDTLAEAGTAPAGPAPADTGAQAIAPPPAAALGAARGAGTSETPAGGTSTDGTSTSETSTSEAPTSETPTSEPVAPTATDPKAGTPAPAVAAEPAPVTVLGAPEQSPADATAPVDNQTAAGAPKALAAGSAPAVPAGAAGPAANDGAVVPDPVRTKVETGVVPEPVNAATPTTTHETSAEPTRDAAADRVDTTSAEDTPATRDGADTPEPVRTTARDKQGADNSTSGSNSGSGSGSDSGSGANDHNGSDNSGSDNGGSDGGSGDNGSDGGGLGGARVSAAVSIHP